MANGNETWVPRCYKCGEGQLILAPANQYTKGIIADTEIYCPHCSWRGKLAEALKLIYVRV